MSEKPSGYGHMVIGQQTRPYHVGTNQGEIFCRLQHRRGEDGLALSLKAYGELFSPVALEKGAFTGGDLRDFVYSALVSGYEVDGLRVDFTPAQVGYWIDDAEATEAAKPIGEMLKQLVKRYERQADRAKNAAAPSSKKTGPKQRKPKA